MLVPFNQALCALQSCQRIISADIILHTGAGVICVWVKSCLVWAVPIYCVMHFSSFVVHINAQAVNFVLCIGFHCDTFLSGLLLPFFTVYHTASPKNRTCRKFFALSGWGGVALRCSPAKVFRQRHFDTLNSAEKNQKKNRIQEKIMCGTPSYHAKPLVNGLFAALCVNIRVRCL